MELTKNKQTFFTRPIGNSVSCGRFSLCQIGMIALWLILANSANGQVRHWKPGALKTFWDLRVNGMEFREPLRFNPFDVKAGLAIYGGPNMISGLPLGLLTSDYSVVQLDSTESEVPSIQSAFKRTVLIYDVDLLQINLRNRFLPLSIIDVFVGLGIRTHQVPFAPAVPEEWPSDGENYRIAPIFHTASASLTIGHQHSDRWYGYVKMMRGVATGNFYKSGFTNRTLSGSGSTRDWVIGIKRFQKSETEPRMSFGAEIRYHAIDVSALDVPTLEDGRALSPILAMDYRSVGAFITFGAYFGGRSTSADRAKKNMYRGDYMAAETDLKAFLLRYPQHIEVKRARELLALAVEMTPYQHLDLAHQYQDNGDLETALEWYAKAEARADTNLIASVIRGKEEVGHIFIKRANDALMSNDLNMTSDLLRNANLLLPDDDLLVERFEAEVLVRRGHALRSQGSVQSAIRNYDDASRLDPSRRPEIEAYKLQIAEDLIDDAVLATDRSALALAVASLKQSQAIDPQHKAVLDSIVSLLEDKLAAKTESEIRRSIDEQMASARELRNFVPPTKPRIGMLVAALEDALGPADNITQADDVIGVNHQIWEYKEGRAPGIYYFENYILTRMEREGSD